MKTHNLESWIGVGVDIPTWCVTSNIVIFKRIYFKGMVNSLILELFLEIFYGEKKVTNFLIAFYISYESDIKIF